MQEVLKKGKSMIRVLKQFIFTFFRINVGCFCVKLIPFSIPTKTKLVKTGNHFLLLNSLFSLSYLLSLFIFYIKTDKFFLRTGTLLYYYFQFPKFCLKMSMTMVSFIFQYMILDREVELCSKLINYRFQISFF